MNEIHIASRAWQSPVPNEGLAMLGGLLSYQEEGSSEVQFGQRVAGIGI